MKKIRRYDEWRWQVITPMNWDGSPGMFYDVSPPIPLVEAIQESVGSFPISLTPPPIQGGRQKLEKLHKRSVPPGTPCEALGCTEQSCFQGETITEHYENNQLQCLETPVSWHKLCPGCFVVWVQEFQQCD